MWNMEKLENTFFSEEEIELFVRNNLNFIQEELKRTFPEEKIVEFIKYINDHKYCALIAENAIFKERCDFLFPLSLYEEMKKRDERFFVEKNEKYLDEILKDGFCLSVYVNDDFDCLYDCNRAESRVNLIKTTKLFLIETLPCFEDFSSKAEEIFDLPDDFWKYNTIDKFYEDYDNMKAAKIENENIDITYQFGGNVIINIQSRGRDLIGFYDGGYGDCGALYIEAYEDGPVNAWVDMH